MPGAAYAAWRESADTIADLTFAEYREKFIHETPKIRRFLMETRAEHFIISAPKGFGKTLLLIAKRMQLNEHSPELDRGGEIVDRPLNTFREVSRDRMAEYRSDFDLWSRIWSYSIMLAAINTHARSSSGYRREAMEQHIQFDPWTQQLLDNRDLYRSPTVIFTSILDQSYSTRRKALESINRLSILFAAVQSQIAFFIDNVDEYFLPILEDRSEAIDIPNGDEDQHKSNEIWVNAQLALVVTAFQLHRGNHHVRVYCTVRKEAFLKLHDHSAEYGQISGCTVEISYNKNDLRIIFNKNVDIMKATNPDSLFHRPGVQQTGLFFGSEGKVMKHRFVTDSEDVFEYVLRHSFYRPRDLMRICGEVAIVPVEERDPLTLSGVEKLREVVNAQSSQLVRQVFSEMKPFFRLPYLDELTSCIPNNALTISDLDTACQRYITSVETQSALTAKEWHPDYRHPFCILYQIGMLGWIQVSQSLNIDDAQRFVKPHEIEVGRSTGLPPTEKYYLIHPALDYLISSRVGKTYLDDFHRHNIIGFDLPWHEPEASLFVIKGDVCGFSRVMASEFYRSISVRLHEWARTACAELDFVEVSGGDSITMIDRSAGKVVDAMLKLLRRADLHGEYPVSFRFGGSAGPVTFEDVERRFNGKWEKTTLPLGQALRSSARLEPHAPKGRLLVDNSFVKAIGRNRNELVIEELEPQEVPTLVYDAAAKTFIVQKSSTDPFQETQLYLVSAR